MKYCMQNDAINLVPDDLRGLDRFEARKQVVADLHALSLLERIEPDDMANRFAGADRPDDAKLEVVCTSTQGSVSAGPEIVSIVLALIVAGIGALYLSSRLRTPKYLVPGTSSTR